MNKAPFFFILFIAVISCSREGVFQDKFGTREGLQSSTNLKKWNFNDPANYDFNADYIKVFSGKASVKAVDLKMDSAGEAAAGQSYGVLFEDGALVPGDANGCDGSSTNCSELDENWAPKWDKIVVYLSMNGSGPVPPQIPVDEGSGSLDRWTDSFNFVPGHLKTGLQNSDGASLVGAGVENISNNLSVAGWVKNDGDPTEYGLVFVAFDSTTGWQIQRFESSEYIYIRVDTNAETAKPCGLELMPALDGKWHHFAFTVSSGTIRAFFNGNLIQTCSYDHGAGFSGPNSIPSFRTPNINGSVKYDEWAVWEDVLTEEEVALIYSRQSANYAGEYKSKVYDMGAPVLYENLFWKTPLPFLKELPGAAGSETSDDYQELVGSFSTVGDDDLMSGLLGLWHFNETVWNGTPGEVIDSGPNGINGAAMNTLQNTTGGRFLKAGAFDGTDDYIDFGAVSALRPDYLTISSWVKTYAVSGTGNSIIHLTSGPFTSLQIISDGTARLEVEGEDAGGPDSVSSAVSVVDGRWHHIVGTYNGSDIKVYVDGKLSNTKAYNGGALEYDPGDPITIGEGDNKTMKGLIDELALWNRALGPDEIRQLYRRGGNRIKYQVRSCSQTNCQDQSTLIGDGWIGPGGDNQSYFSELQNAALGLPYLVFDDYGGAPASNRYFQWRAVLESDDENDLCSGSPCMPELLQVSLNPRTGNVASGDVVPKYFSGRASISNATSVNFHRLGNMTIVEEGDCDIFFQLSNTGGADYLYFDGSDWAVAATDTHANTKGEIASNISSFPKGDGLFNFKAILSTTPDEECSIKEISLKYAKEP